jgi:hypothetical protein
MQVDERSGDEEHAALPGPITLHYDEGLVRRAVKAFWWRRTGWSYLAGFCVLLSLFVMMVRAGERSWMVGAMGTILGLSAVLVVSLYVVHYRAAFVRFRRMGKPEATIELGEERFRVTSGAGASECPWTAVTEVWTYPEFLLVLLSPAVFLTMPTADLGTKGRDFLIGKALSKGAKVS